MPLIKHRPKLGLRTHTIVAPGARATGTVIIDAKRDVPIEAITVDLKGEEHVTFSSGNSSTTHRHPVLNLRATLTGPELIPSGRHELPFTFDVPEDAPPSYAFGWARVEYVATVRVDIDWWPDAVERFLLRVGHPKREAVEARPQVYSTSPQGPVGSTPVLEASLATDIVPLGGTVDIAVGLENTGATRFRDAQLSLIALETRFDSKNRNRGRLEVKRYTLRVPVEKVLEGLPIRMQVPDVPPTIASRLFQLDWVLDVRATVAFGSDIVIRVPITLVPEGGVRIRKGLAPAPVGTSRQRAIWERVAMENGLSFDGQRMFQTIGDVEIDVSLGHRKNGIVLVGALTHPSLHLGLDGGAKGSFHRFVGASVDVDDERFARTHYVTGRDAGQVRAFVAGLGEWFFAQELEDLSDEGMTFTTRRRTESALTRMCRVLRGLAERIGDARRAIPPPTSLSDAARVWERVAKREGATFEPARMALHFQRGEDRSIVVTEWDSRGVAYRTTVALYVRDPIDDDYVFLSTAGALGEDEVPKYGADARQILSRLVEDTPHVRVEATALVAHLEPELHDPEGPLAILKRLEALYVLLRGKTGPYR